MQIPNTAQCLEFFDRFEMLDNIRIHSLTVAQVAAGLVDGLTDAGRTEMVPADRDEVVAGALLHDIAKTRCILAGGRHAEEGREICRQLGYHEIGEIVAEHVVLSRFTPELYRRGIFSARELVYYADKRVRHEQVVSLDDRLEYIIERYGNNEPARIEHIRQNFSTTQTLEKLLFSFLDFAPAQLADRLGDLHGPRQP